jgi:Type IV secretion system proteins
MKKTAVSIISALIVSSAIAQVPTTDTVALTQRAEQALTLYNQLKTLKSQLDEAKAMAKSLTTDRGLANVLNTVSEQVLRKTISPEVFDVLKGSSGNGISGPIDDLIKALPAGKTKQDAERLRSVFGQQSYGQDAYAQADKRIKALYAAIETAPKGDLKAIAELTLAVQAQAVQVANEQLKLNSLKIVADAAEKILEDKRNSSSRSFMLSSGALSSPKNSTATFLAR